MDTNKLDVQTIRWNVDRVLAERREEIYHTVRSCISEALKIDVDAFDASATLITELAAESLDYLDIIFRLERAFDVKIPKGGILDAVRMDLKGQPIDVKGRLTADAIDRLQVLMPEVDPTKLVDGLRAHDVSDLFTVETFVRLVAWRLIGANSEAVA